jgi:Fur family ferric uptake transcriptional regulator
VNGSGPFWPLTCHSLRASGAALALQGCLTLGSPFQHFDLHEARRSRPRCPILGSATKIEISSEALAEYLSEWYPSSSGLSPELATINLVTSGLPGDLREHGIQATAQRMAVLRAVASCPHVTADEVAKVAGLDIGTISRQTVYDALGLLVEKGLIRRIQPVGSAALYEDRVNDNHHHLICRICGDVVDVDCATAVAPCLETGDNLGFEVDEAEISFWGRCPLCQMDDQTVTRLDPPIDRSDRGGHITSSSPFALSKMVTKRPSNNQLRRTKRRKSARRK